MKKMPSPNLPHRLIRLAIVVAIPAIACFGYYSVDHLSENNNQWTTLVLLAYPTILIGVIGLGMTLLSPRNSKFKQQFWIAVILIPTLLLIFIRI